MYLNYDCLRDVLLSLERNLAFVRDDFGLAFPDYSFQDLMSDPDVGCYGEEDVFYAVHNLVQAEYITASIGYDIGMTDYCSISDITYKGHMFLRSISDVTVWSAVKKRFGPALQASLPVLQQVASQCVLHKFGFSD